MSVYLECHFPCLSKSKSCISYLSSDDKTTEIESIKACFRKKNIYISSSYQVINTKNCTYARIIDTRENTNECTVQLTISFNDGCPDTKLKLKDKDWRAVLNEIANYISTSSTLGCVSNGPFETLIFNPSKVSFTECDMIEPRKKK